MVVGDSRKRDLSQAEAYYFQAIDVFPEGDPCKTVHRHPSSAFRANCGIVASVFVSLGADTVSLSLLSAALFHSPTGQDQHVRIVCSVHAQCCFPHKVTH